MGGAAPAPRIGWRRGNGLGQTGNVGRRKGRGPWPRRVAAPLASSRDAHVSVSVRSLSIVLAHAENTNRLPPGLGKGVHRSPQWPRRGRQSQAQCQHHHGPLHNDLTLSSRGWENRQRPRSRLPVPGRLGGRGMSREARPEPGFGLFFIGLPKSSPGLYQVNTDGAAVIRKRNGYRLPRQQLKGLES
jgi:hypothetical protein